MVFARSGDVSHLEELHTRNRVKPESDLLAFPYEHFMDSLAALYSGSCPISV